MADNNFFVSVDIGSSKIIVLIAELLKDERISVFGHGIGVSSGVENGAIVNVKQVVKAVKKVVKSACESCNIKPVSVIVNISDIDLYTVNKIGKLLVNGKKITEKNVVAVIDTAISAISIPANKQFFDKTINYFAVGGDELSTATKVEFSPIDLEGTFLHVSTHVTVVSNQVMENVQYSIEQNHLGIEKLVLDSIAGSKTCISQSDKESGVCLLDIGAGVTNVSVFVEGKINHSCVLKTGGNQISDNIAYAFNTSFAEAERLKIECGYSQLKHALEDKLLAFTQLKFTDTRYLSLHDLISVIEKSYLSICIKVKQVLTEQKLNGILKAGIVLTGGVVQMAGCETLFLNTLGVRTRLATINTDKITANQAIILNPIYNSALGLLLCMEADNLQRPQEKPESSGFMSKIKLKLET